MKAITLILIVLIAISACQNQHKQAVVWSAAYEAKLAAQLNESMQQRLPDQNEREAMIRYMIKELKIALPAGVESVSADSQYVVSSKIGAAYAYIHPGAVHSMTPTRVAWRPELQAAFKGAILKDWPKNDLENGYKLCDCAILKLKAIYPDSVVLPFPKDTLAKIVRQCMTNQSAKKSKT